ncbi:MAG: hypothetical protein IJO99_06945 [Ruminococcus sp.]|nr:hypothetical protein [Ruminococcus sp.]
MKKKILSLALAFTMLTGCGEKENQKSQEMQYFSALSTVYNDGLVYNFGLDSPTMYLDLNSLEKSALCAMPNCTHTIGSCLAQMIGENPVFYDEYIYYFMSDYGYNEVREGHQFYMKSTLCRAKLDSSETEKIAEFTDCVPAENGGMVLDGKTLWFVGDDKNTIPENVYDSTWIPSSDTQGSHFICSIDLETGEYKNFGSITDEDKQYEFRSMCNNANIRGIYEDKLVLDYQYAFKNMEEYNNGADNPTDCVKILSFEYDTKTETLTQSDRLPPFYAENDIYIGFDYSTGCISTIYNGEEHSFESDIYPHSYSNGKLFCFDKWVDLSDYSIHTLSEELCDSVKIIYHNGRYVSLNAKGQITEFTEEELI